MDFSWDLCPRCQATGTVSEPFLPQISDTTAITYRPRDCEACDGLGRIKVPIGYRLEPVPVYGTYTVAGANATTTKG